MLRQRAAGPPGPPPACWDRGWRGRRRPPRPSSGRTWSSRTSCAARRSSGSACESQRSVSSEILQSWTNNTDLKPKKRLHSRENLVLRISVLVREHLKNGTYVVPKIKIKFWRGRTRKGWLLPDRPVVVLTGHSVHSKPRQLVAKTDTKLTKHPHSSLKFVENSTVNHAAPYGHSGKNDELEPQGARQQLGHNTSANTTSIEPTPAAA